MAVCLTIFIGLNLIDTKLIEIDAFPSLSFAINSFTMKPYNTHNTTKEH